MTKNKMGILVESKENLKIHKFTSLSEIWESRGMKDLKKETLQKLLKLVLKALKAFVLLKFFEQRKNSKSFLNRNLFFKMNFDLRD